MKKKIFEISKRVVMFFFPFFLISAVFSLGRIFADVSTFSEALVHPYEENQTGELPLTTKGKVMFTIETIREQTPRMRSILAKRIEIWKGDSFIASLSDGEAGVLNSFHRRTFSFQAFELPKGYHFLTIKAYAEGFVSREIKWKGRTVQIGVHPGRTTKIKMRFPFFVW